MKEVDKNRLLEYLKSWNPKFSIVVCFDLTQKKFHGPPKELGVMGFAFKLIDKKIAQLVWLLDEGIYLHAEIEEIENFIVHPSVKPGYETLFDFLQGGGEGE